MVSLASEEEQTRGEGFLGERQAGSGAAGDAGSGPFWAEETNCGPQWNAPDFAFAAAGSVLSGPFQKLVSLERNLSKNSAA